MTDKFEKSFEFFRKMSTLKKVLITFVVLLIFVIIVEQPGSDASKRRKGEKFFIPKLVAEEVQKIKVRSPITKEDVVLEKKEGSWRIANGRSFPADVTKVDGFIKALHNLKEGSLVSKNPDRMAIFSVDEAKGTHVQLWNHKERTVSDFFAGEAIPDGQYIRLAGSSEVFQTTPTLLPFLTETTDGWKDKTLLTIDEGQVRRVALKMEDQEIVLEKGETDEWRVIQPEDYVADDLAIRTLFEQLKQVKAENHADSVEGSQADFENPDYKISIRLVDDALKLVLFSKSDDENKYFAKNGETNFVYTVSSDLIDNIFGLEFKSE